MKRKSLFIQLLIFICLALMVINAKLSYDSYLDLLEYNRGYSLAKEDSLNFMAGSDYLTEQCRLYITTGNFDNVKNYFYEIDTTRRREIAVQMLTTYSTDCKKEAEYLQSSYQLSEELKKYEIHAMKIIAYIDGVDEKDMPQQLKDYQLSIVEKTYNRRILKEIATKMVFGEEYVTTKNEIGTKVTACANLLSTHSWEQKNRITEKMHKHMEIMFILIVLISAFEILAHLFSLPFFQKNESTSSRNRKKGGFSIMELIVVLTIIIVLGCIMVPVFYQYVGKSVDTKAEQNAMEFKHTTEIVLVDLLMNDGNHNEISPLELKYQALSSEAPAPSNQPGSTIIRTIYDSINIGGGKYEVIALINDYKVTQVTYRDCKTNKVYVWFDSFPEGVNLQSEQYFFQREKWLVFHIEDQDPWVLQYSKIIGEDGVVHWNGYVQ